MLQIPPEFILKTLQNEYNKSMMNTILLGMKPKH